MLERIKQLKYYVRELRRAQADYDEACDERDNDIKAFLARDSQLRASISRQEENIITTAKRITDCSQRPESGSSS